MSKPPDSSIQLSKTLHLSEYKTGGYKGFWLYDETRKMNLSMRANSIQEALIECIEYYQNRLLEVEKNWRDLSFKVDSFVNQFIDDNEKSTF